MYTYHHHHYHQDRTYAQKRSTTKGLVPPSSHKITLTGTERFSTKLTELVALLTLKIRVDPSLYVEQMIRAYEVITQHENNNWLLPLKDETDSDLAHGMKITTFQTYFTMLHKYLKANNKFHKAFVPPPIKKLKGFPELSNPDLQAPFGGETLKRQLHDAFIHLWIDTSQNYADTFEEAKKINEIIVQPLLAFCVKLSELHLRPFLLQLKEYVMKSFSTMLPPNDIPTITSNDEGFDCSTSKALSPILHQQKVSETFENKLVPLQIDAPYRMAFFVQFILGLADQLNLLFSLFFDIVYEPISKILLLRPDSPVNTFLVEGALKILSLGLSYTNEIKGYVGDPKKATLLKALMNVDSISPSTVMDNIDNQLQLMTTEKYESLCSTLINLILEYFSLTRVQAVRSFDSSSIIQQPRDQNKKIIDILAELNKLHAIEGDWRIFNDLVLKMTHNVDPQQRLLGIQIFTRVFERCGEEYLVLLPEMLSNIAELLEDDVEEVENSCRSLVEIIEKLLGEPLEKYF